MNEIARIKNEVRLKQWTEMVRQRNESGLNVSQWCRQNGINQKTYYYRLNRVRKALCGEVEKHEIVPVNTEPEIAVSHEQISFIFLASLVLYADTISCVLRPSMENCTLYCAITFTSFV